MADQIKKLEVGEQAEIVGYSSGSAAYRSSFLSMGLTNGTVVKLVKVAPLGDPIELEVRGFKLSLRKTEAEVLQIRQLENQGVQR